MSGNVTFKRETVFSHDRRYRYTLWREWGNIEPVMDLLCSTERERIGTRDKFVQFIGLNPSTADERLDDPTIRRCIEYSKSWGYGAMCMTNLFAWRSTDPYQMRLVESPFGQDNEKWLFEIATEADLVICAWGNHGEHLDAGKKLTEQLRHFCPEKLRCLKLNTKYGHPSHPLYLSASRKPIAF